MRKLSSNIALIVLLGLNCEELNAAANKQLTSSQLIDSAHDYYYKSQFDKSIEWGTIALNKGKREKNKKDIMLAHLAIAKSQYYVQDFPSSMSNLFSSLKLAVELKNKEIISDCHNCIGNIYYAQKEYTKAIEYYNLSIKGDPEKGISSRKAACFSYLAGIFFNTRQYDSSEANYQKAITAYKTFKDTINLITMQQNLAGVYSKMGKRNEAKKLFNEVLEVSLKMKSPGEIGYIYFSIGLFYADGFKDRLAIDNFKKALPYFEEINEYTYISNTCQALANSYYGLKMYKEAMDNFVRYTVFQDSSFNIEQAKEITRKEVQFQMEKKQLADSLKRTVIEKENQIRNDEKMKRQAIYKYIGAGGFLVMLIIVIILLRSNRAKQSANLKISQQKAEVELQKLMIEEKQKEILDSIKYAKRIQMALLPSNKYIEKNLNGGKK